MTLAFLKASGNNVYYFKSLFFLMIFGLFVFSTELVSWDLIPDVIRGPRRITLKISH